MADPARKEVAAVRKRIDVVNRELKPLGQSCLKKVRLLLNCLPQLNIKTFFQYFLILLWLRSIHVCLWMKEKEYKHALEAFNEKNKEKAQLINKLMEVHFFFFCLLCRFNLHIINTFDFNYPCVFDIWAAGGGERTAENEEAGGVEQDYRLSSLNQIKLLMWFTKELARPAWFFVMWRAFSVAFTFVLEISLVFWYCLFWQKLFWNSSELVRKCYVKNCNWCLFCCWVFF